MKVTLLDKAGKQTLQMQLQVTQMTRGSLEQENQVRV